MRKNVDLDREWCCPFLLSRFQIPIAQSQIAPGRQQRFSIGENNEIGQASMAHAHRTETSDGSLRKRQTFTVAPNSVFGRRTPHEERLLAIDVGNAE